LSNFTSDGTQKKAKADAKTETVEISIPLSKAGQYIVEVEARAGSNQATLRYPLLVEEPAP